MSGLNTATAIHMFRRVFGNTPSFCTSMKFAELSKPLIPKRPAAKPKNNALPIPPGEPCAQFDKNTSKLNPNFTNAKPTRRTSVVMCVTKIPIATTADSVMPTRLRNAKNPSRPKVACTTGSECANTCA